MCYNFANAELRNAGVTSKAIILSAIRDIRVHGCRQKIFQGYRFFTIVPHFQPISFTLSFFQFSRLFSWRLLHVCVVAWMIASKFEHAPVRRWMFAHPWNIFCGHLVSEWCLPSVIWRSCVRTTKAAYPQSHVHLIKSCGRVCDISHFIREIRAELQSHAGWMHATTVYTGWAKINRTMNFLKRDLSQTLTKKR